MRRWISNDRPQTWRSGAWWNCFKSPTPIRIKLVPAKVQAGDLLYRTHVIDLVWCVFFNSIGNFCEQNGVLKNSACVFWFVCQNGVCIWGKPTSSNKFFVLFYVVVRGWRCSLYIILKKYFAVVWLLSVNYESCFDKNCAEIVACPRVLASMFTFVTLHLSRFFRYHTHVFQAEFQAMRGCEAVFH